MENISTNDQLFLHLNNSHCKICINPQTYIFIQDSIRIKTPQQEKTEKRSTNNNKKIHTNLITYHLYPLHTSYPNTKLFVTIYITINREKFVYVYSL